MKRSKNLKWAVWALAAFFYFYEYLLRVSPNVMVFELMEAFDASAAQLGVLIASFLAIYAPMQLPVGILMDRFGARKLLTFASIVCGLGTLVFALSESISFAYVGRIFIGIGASFGFVGMVFVCSHWFEMKKRALLVGVANSISMLGAFAGGGPLSVMISHLGWRVSLLFWSVIGFILAFVIFSLVRKDTEDMHTLTHTEETPHSLFEGIKIFSKNIHCWLNAVVALLYYSVTTAFGGLWGVPFIKGVYNVKTEVASFAVSMIFIGWLVGGPIMGALSDRLQNRKSILIAGAIGTLLSFTPIIYFTSISIFTLYTLIFLTGFFSSAQLINFTYATELIPAHVKGASIAVTNFVVALGGMVIQPLIGYLLVFHQKMYGLNSQAHTYSALDYKWALSVVPLCLAAACLLSLFLKNRKKTV